MKYENLDQHLKKFVSENQFVEWHTRIVNDVNTNTDNNDLFQKLLNAGKELEINNEKFFEAIEKADEKFEYQNFAELIVQGTILIDESNKVLLPIIKKKKEEDRMIELKKTSSLKNKERTEKLAKEIKEKRTIQPPKEICNVSSEKFQQVKQELEQLKNYSQERQSLFNNTFAQVSSHIKFAEATAILDADFKNFFLPVQKYFQLSSMERQKLINKAEKLNSEELELEIHNVNRILNNPLLLKKYKDGSTDQKGRNATAMLVEILYVYKFVKFIKELPLRQQQQTIKQSKSEDAVTPSFSKNTNHLYYYHDQEIQQPQLRKQGEKLFKEAVFLCSSIQADMQKNNAVDLTLVTERIKEFKTKLESAQSLGYEPAKTYLDLFHPLLTEILENTQNTQDNENIENAVHVVKPNI